MVNTSVFKGDEGRWNAIVDRDQNADGVFYYAVKTTGIFCRPGCSSRLPNRENVEYFDTCKEAEAAGYRPCKKCTPTTNTKSEEIGKKIIRACRSIEQSDTPLKLNDLAREAQLSPYHFHRLFKKIVGVTPKQYSSSHQSQRFKENLKTTQSVTDAIYTAGYSSSSGVYNKRQEQLAMKPKAYKNGAAGITISYGLVECFLGWIIVAATERGICAIEFGDEPKTLSQQVQDRFPKATLQKAGSGFVALIKEVVDFIETPGSNFTIPLDIQGTAFQQQVWNILRQIKPGETLSYTEVAEKIGNPNGARAVATACASNKLAVVIPCHRVISKDGKISGYRWGVERKKMLLEMEKDKG
jgi:AraC family transcriptional regulator, regulatory protein of adaptative response / methylated-DNA-[protein]-cysteine methyltransferase